MKTSLLHWTESREEVEKRTEGAESCRKGNRLKRVIRAALNALLNRFAPMGYQDEDGFHYGEQRPD